MKTLILICIFLFTFAGQGFFCSSNSSALNDQEVALHINRIHNRFEYISNNIRNYTIKSEFYFTNPSFKDVNLNTNPSYNSLFDKTGNSNVFDQINQLYSDLIENSNLKNAKEEKKYFYETILVKYQDALKNTHNFITSKEFSTVNRSSLLKFDFIYKKFSRDHDWIIDLLHNPQTRNNTVIYVTEMPMQAREVKLF